MKIGILTCGMDSPGMNAVIWAAERAAHSLDIEFVGIKNGFMGLIDDEIMTWDKKFINRMFLLGGSIIGAKPCNAQKSDELIDEVMSTLKRHEIDGLIICGDKKSLSCVENLYEMGLPVVGIPATIDNDVAFTDACIGFDTVCNVVVDAIMNLRNTIMSQKCIAVVEVAGRACGDIAMNAGMASGTDYILVPEMIQDYGSEFDIDNMFSQIERAWQNGKHYIIVVVSEGVTAAYENSDIKEMLQKKINEYNQLLDDDCTYEDHISENVIYIPLGNLQRGGNPTVQDTRIAMEMALMAVNLIADGKGGKMVGIKKNEIFNINCSQAKMSAKVFDKQMYDRVNSVLTSR